jgi:hypothetical protein
VLRLPALVGADWRGAGDGGRSLRGAAVAVSVVAGVTLALFTVQYAGPWLHFHSDH